MIDNKLNIYRTHCGVYSVFIFNRRSLLNVKDKLHYKYFLEETYKRMKYGTKRTRRGLDMIGYYHKKFS